MAKQPTIRKQQGCNEDCLRRIAARLCVLHECSRDNRLPADDGCAPHCDVACGGETERDGCCGKTAATAATACGSDAGVSEMRGTAGGCSSATANKELNPPPPPSSSSSSSSSRPCEEKPCCAAGECGGIPVTTSKVGSCRIAALAASEEDDCATETNKSGKCCGTRPADTSIASCSTPALAVPPIAAITSGCCSSANANTRMSSAVVDATPACCNENSGAAADKKSTTTCTQVSAEDEDECANDCRSAAACEVASTASETERCADKCCTENTAVGRSEPPASCFDHLQAAMDRYEAVLKRGLCLCRMAIEQLGFNCCALDTARSFNQRCSASVDATTKNDCGKKIGTSTETEIHPRCSSDRSAKKSIGYTPVLDKRGDTDVEKSASREHVVLTVTGMTCTGCSRKMMNVLSAISGLSNAQVTFVSGSAEFDLDTDTSGTSEKVLVRIEKETGFKCFRILAGRQDLSVLMTAETAKLLQHASPAGLMSVVKNKKDLYAITYDPTVIGARSLLPPDARLAPPSDAAGIAEGKRRLIETALSTALATMLTIPVVVLEWSSNPVPEKTVSVITLVLGTCVQTIAIPEFYVGALKSLIYSHVIEMDMLVVISITAAYVYSVVAFGLQQSGFQLEQEAFFATSTMLITLVLLGRLIATWARMRAVSAVSMRSLQAETATLICESGNTTTVDARLLHFGDTIAIAPHSRIVTDGEVVSGVSEVDESMITGESLPVPKQSGDKVIAGTFNGSGSVHVAISRLPGENSITDIATLVENAVAAKPKVQELADKVASWFIPAVVGIALIVFCIWVAVALEVRNRNAGGAVGLSVTYAIAVLAISCPCALGLAVPMVLVIAGGIATRAGIIIKAADALERGYKITDVILDKTGTLTEGDLHVVFEKTDFHRNMQADEARSVVVATVEGNTHPVSVSVAAYLNDKHPDLPKKSPEFVTSVPGAGIEAQFGFHCVKAGNPYWLRLEDHPDVTAHLAEATTLLCVILDDKLIAIYGLKSTLRPNAGPVIAELAARNIACHIVSGDNSAAVLDVADLLNVAHTSVLCGSSPAQKQEYVQNLQRLGRQVLFLGDGTNDAVAMAQADVGVQMGSASDVTGAVADVVLLSHNLESLLALLSLSRSAVRRIVFNFAWSAIYNVFAILLASGAFVKFRIPPAYAGLGEIVSVLPVIVAAATLALGRKQI